MIGTVDDAAVFKSLFHARVIVELYFILRSISSKSLRIFRALVRGSRGEVIAIIQN